MAFSCQKLSETWECAYNTGAPQGSILGPLLFKDISKEKAPSSNTLALTRSMNMGIWVVSTSNQLFHKRFLTETKFSKK